MAYVIDCEVVSIFEDGSMTGLCFDKMEVESAVGVNNLLDELVRQTEEHNSFSGMTFTVMVLWAFCYSDAPTTLFHFVPIGGGFA